METMKITSDVGMYIFFFFHVVILILSLLQHNLGSFEIPFFFNQHIQDATQGHDRSR